MKRALFASLVLLTAGAAFAQAPPHIVVCTPIVYSDGVTPVLAADLTFDAYIQTRPGEVIHETTSGCAVYDDVGGAGAFIECSSFTTIWAVGDVMVVVFTGSGSNYSQSETQEFLITLTNENPQFAAGEGYPPFVLPVELTSFTAEPSAGMVTLRWETASEVENIGFNVLRGTEREGAYSKINGEMIPGAGTTTEPRSYSFVDENISGGLYFYQLEAIATNGDKQLSGIVEVRPTPAVFALASGYPNPMTQTSEIAFQLPKDSIVSLRVYNMAGREVSVLQQGTLQAGYYAKTWNGTDADGRVVGNGVYFVRMDAQGFNATKKLVVLR